MITNVERIDRTSWGDEFNINLMPWVSPTRYSALREVHTGSGDDEVEITGGANPQLQIFLGAGDNELIGTVAGSVVYGETGADTFYYGKDYLIADADDFVSLLGKILTGGIRMANSESVWAKGLAGGTEVISEIFRAMNTKIENRASADLLRWANVFPYVNGASVEGKTSAASDMRRKPRLPRLSGGSLLGPSGGRCMRERNARNLPSDRFQKPISFRFFHRNLLNRNNTCILKNEMPDQMNAQRFVFHE